MPNKRLGKGGNGVELLLGRSTALIFSYIKKKTFQVWGSVVELFTKTLSKHIMKSSKCPGMFSEDGRANIKPQSESISGWEALKEAQRAH